MTDSPKNPRWLLWLRAHSLTEASFDEDRRVTIDGDNLPAAVHYTLWIQARWFEWAKELGFKRDGTGRYAHEVALMNGRTHAEFDAWLEAKVKGIEATR